MPSESQPCHSLSTANGGLPVFVATNLPGDEHIGCEPTLSNAICEGLRVQGISVADISEQYESLSENLLTGGSTEQALDYVYNVL